ncbi:uncharacterized protein LOC108740908 [Agrilus planipennis]|uniref:Uncharacterized protein LOC108740908 n=1 Tax=Agrilus planipennis TaxID=224129 RepID=A0A1W4X4C0_AGRPL|nr:uncharacterized protein LOC108740908 [Agrilus planipennis]
MDSVNRDPDGYKYKSKWNPTSTVESTNAKIISIRSSAEHMLHSAIIMAEMGMDLKEKSANGEKYVSYLRNLALRAGKTIKCLQGSGKSFLLLAQKLILSTLATLDTVAFSDPVCSTIKLEYEKLLSVVEKELADLEDIEATDTTIPSNFKSQSITKLSEKIKYLETKQKLADNTLLPPCGSARSVKSDIDEKYPENLSRESLIDLNNVVNLPPVPEDIFTSFSNKPVRTSSLSSLKSMRKVKLFLQRASSGSDDEDESCSEIDDPSEFARIVPAEAEEKATTTSPAPTKKIQLSYIQEEVPD